MITGKSIYFALGFGTALIFSSPRNMNAADWPQWRGPDRDGISKETGLAKQWPPGGPKLVWKAKGLGDGYSTVSFVGDRLYTIGETSASSFVIALSAVDGKEVWRSKLGKPGAPGNPKFEGPRSTPTVDGPTLFALGQWGELVCLDLKDGKELWRKDYTKDLSGKRPEWGFADSPIVDGNNVIVTPGGPDGAVAALERKSGAVVWRSKDFKDPAHYSSLIIAEIGGTRQYICLTAASVAGVAAKDGQLLWQAPRKGKVAVIPTPVYSDGFVYFTSGYGVGCNLFQVTGSGTQFSAKEVYANDVMANHHGGVIKIGNFIYGYSDSKGWTCQDFKTGQAKWQEKSKLGKGSVVAVNGMLILRQEDNTGRVALIEASPDGYKEHGRFDQPDRSKRKSWPHPVVANGKLYLRDQDVLLCYDVKAR
jgi:outer membrane protein assembly factor BamB